MNCEERDICFLRGSRQTRLILSRSRAILAPRSVFGCKLPVLLRRASENKASGRDFALQVRTNLLTYTVWSVEPLSKVKRQEVWWDAMRIGWEGAVMQMLYRKSDFACHLVPVDRKIRSKHPPGKSEHSVKSQTASASAMGRFVCHFPRSLSLLTDGRMAWMPNQMRWNQIKY